MLKSRPRGTASEQNFELVTRPIPEPGPGELLLRTMFLSVDPYMRDLMNAVAYDTPIKVGEVMRGEVVAQVVRSRVSTIPVGSLVTAWVGWQEYGVVSADKVRLVPPNGLPPSTALGVLGMTGLTAYAGLHEVGQPQPGDTVVVAAAAGAVGSTAVQLAKIAGARVVAIVGRPDKVEWLRTIGADEALNHRSPSFEAELRAATSEGIDVYFENVGGAVWEAVAPLLKRGARVPVCGYIAHYDHEVQHVWIHDRAVLANLTERNIVATEFLVTEFEESHRERFLRDVTAWIEAGMLTYTEQFVDGLENAPTALLGLLSGANLGKQIVRVAPHDPVGRARTSGCCTIEPVDALPHHLARDADVAERPE